MDLFLQVVYVRSERLGFLIILFTDGVVRVETQIVEHVQRACAFSEIRQCVCRDRHLSIYSFLRNVDLL